MVEKVDFGKFLDNLKSTHRGLAGWKPVLTQSQWEGYRKIWGDEALMMFDVVPDPWYFNYDKLEIHDKLEWGFNNYARRAVNSYG